MKKAIRLPRALAFLLSVALVLTSFISAFADAGATQKEDLDLITFDNVTADDYLTVLPIWGGAMSNSDKLALIQGGVAGNALQLTQSGTSGDFVLKMAYKKVDGTAQFFDVSSYKFFRFWIKAPADKDVSGVNFRLAGNYTGGGNNNEEAIAKTGTFYLEGSKNGEAYSASIEHTSIMLTIPAGFEGYVYTPMADFKTLYDGTTALANGVNKTRFVNFVMPTKNDGAVVVIDRLGFTDTDPTAVDAKEDLDLITFDNVTADDYLTVLPIWGGAMSNSDKLALIQGGVAGNALQLTQSGTSGDFVLKMAYKKVDGTAQFFDVSSYKFFRFWIKAPADKDVANVNFRLAGNYTGGGNNNEEAIAKTGTFYLKGTKDGEAYSAAVEHTSIMLTIPAGFEGYVYTPMADFKTLYDGTTALANGVNKTRFVNFVVPTKNDGAVVVIDRLGFTDTDPNATGAVSKGTFMLIDFDNQKQYNFLETQAGWVGAMAPAETMTLSGGYHGRGLHIVQDAAEKDGKIPDIAAMMAFRKDADNKRVWMDISGYKYLRFWVKTGASDVANLSIRLNGYVGTTNNNATAWLDGKNGYDLTFNGKKDGTAYTETVHQPGKMTLPANFEGYVYLPMTAFGSADLTSMSIINFVMPGSNNKNEIVLDEIAMTDDEVTVAPGEATPDNSVDVKPGDESSDESSEAYDPGPVPTPTDDFIAFDFDKNSDDDFQTELAPWIPAPENWEQIWALDYNFTLVPGGVTQDGKAMQITQNRAAGDIAGNIAFKKNGAGHDLVDLRGYKYFRVWIKTPESDEDGGMDFVSFRLKGIYNKNGKDVDSAAYLKCNTKCYLNGTLNGRTYNGEFYNNTQGQSFVLPYNFEGYLYMPLDRFDLYENVGKDTEPSSIAMDRMKYLILVMPGSRAGRVSLWDDFRFTNTEPLIDAEVSEDPADSSEPEESENSIEESKNEPNVPEESNANPDSPDTGDMSLVLPALALMVLSAAAVTLAVKRRKVQNG